MFPLDRLVLLRVVRGWVGALWGLKQIPTYIMERVKHNYFISKNHLFLFCFRCWFFWCSQHWWEWNIIFSLSLVFQSFFNFHCHTYIFFLQKSNLLLTRCSSINWHEGGTVSPQSTLLEEPGDSISTKILILSTCEIKHASWILSCIDTLE